ncbi:MAG TPA: class I SAM-dependent methyltransferase [Candidatus Acidoferrales bacterium]|nr:class I SAM-dependent methyltransferase [Candidatus Acidoferrales bacterium]
MGFSRADKILDWVKGPKVLDVGCTSHTVEIGSAEWLHGRLREKFLSVAGIDISAQNVETLKRHGFGDVHVASAETFELPGKFDTVVAGEVIEHLANPGLFLRQARAHLEPDGRLVLTTPNPFSVAYFLYAVVKYPKTCYNPEHTCWFCLRTMTEIAQRNGFRVSHFDLIDDYGPGDPSFLYRQFGRLMVLMSPMLPKRLRKTMLFVLVPDHDRAAS